MPDIYIDPEDSFVDLAKPYEVSMIEDTIASCLRITLSDKRKFFGNSPAPRAMTVIITFEAIEKAASDGNYPSLVRGAILRLKSKIQEKLSADCDNKEVRLWAAKFLEADLMDNSPISKRIWARYEREGKNSNVEETPRPKVNSNRVPNRVVRRRSSQQPHPVDTEVSEPRAKTVVGARSKTPPRKPKCNSRDHEERVEMVYDPEEGLWKCPEPGCKMIARPKTDVPIGGVTLGKGRLDIRVLFTDAGKKPSILLVSDDNVALDVTEFVEDMEKFLQFGRVHEVARLGVVQKTNSAEVTRKVTLLLAFSKMKVQGCENA